MISLALTLVLAQAPDAGVLGELYAKCGDAPLVTVVDGGYFVPEARAARNNCKLAACEFAVVQAVARKEAEAAQPSTVLALTSGAISLVAAALVVGYYLPHPFPPSPPAPR